MAVRLVEVPEFADLMLELVGGEHPVLVLDDVPDLHGEPRERERRGVPVLARFFLPLRPDLIVALADCDLAIGDLLLEVGVAADPLLAGFDQSRNADRGVTERAYRAGLHAAI